MVTGTVHKEIDRFLGQGPVPLYIGGAWTAPHGGEVIEVQDPANGTVLAEVAAGGSADIDDAVTAANRAFPPTGLLSYIATRTPSRTTSNCWPASNRSTWASR
jgi:hypothetical protein